MWTAHSSYIPRYIPRSPILRVSFFCLADDKEMFNRCKQIEFLSRVLVDKPQFSIVTGPIDSGKTRLIEKVLQEIPPKNNMNVPICPVNLRKGAYYTVASLVDSFSQEMSSWLDRVWSNTNVEVCAEGKSEASVKASSVGGKVGGSVSISFGNKKITSPTDPLNLLLKQVAS